MIQRVGRYEIIEKTGEADAFEVFRAADPETDRGVTVRVSSGDRPADAAHVERILREAGAACLLLHPNIITTLEVGQVEARPYIVTEMADGAPLDQVLEAEGKLPPAQAMAIGLQLADALHHAHDAGIVHRGLGPGNILISPDGATARIADFGIVAAEETDQTRQVAADAVPRAARYLSPEQIAGRPADGRSDLFSLGVVLYEMLAGAPPFDEQGMAALLSQITRDGPRPIGDLAPETPPGLQRIIARLMAKQADERYATGAELAAALQGEMQARQAGTPVRAGLSAWAAWAAWAAPAIRAARAAGTAVRAARTGRMALGVKWTLSIAALLAVIMAGGIYMVAQTYSRVLTRIAVDQGAALARFIAGDTAELLLIQDWVAIELFVDAAAALDSVGYLVVLDHEKLVRGATDRGLVGMPYAEGRGETQGEPRGEPLSTAPDGLSATMIRLADGSKVMDFDAPIVYQGTIIGRIRLGLSQSEAEGALDRTMWSLIALALVTIAVVVAFLHGVARGLSRRLGTLRGSMDQIAAGNLDCRIGETRNDELGRLFTSFNKMASALEQDGDGDARPPAAS